jgi:outer membrane protein assembly factor BamA
MKQHKKTAISFSSAAALLLFCFVIVQKSTAQFSLQINYIGKDNSFMAAGIQLQKSFTGFAACLQYVNKLPQLLSSKGFPTASVDSTWYNDSIMFINLYTGKQYEWVKLLPVDIEKKALDESGFLGRNFEGKLINIPQLQVIQRRILNYYEKNGYPFAEVFLDSITLVNNKINAQLKVKKSVLYHVDSLRIFGKAKISKKYLYHYLGLRKGGIYNKEKLQQVSKKIESLSFLQEVQSNDISMLGTGSILNLYLANRRSSEFNGLIGLLPGDGITTKFQFTGDVKLNLVNALSSGEAILLNWQNLQRKSPRLNLAWQQPYIFNSDYGLDFSFDLFKKDSSFLNINAQLGASYILSATQQGKIFVNWQNCFLLANGVDTNMVKFTKQLPPNIDVNATSIGLDYDLYKTNYRFNPRSGTEFKLVAAAGIKKIKKNNDIISLKDPLFDYNKLYDSINLRTYQIRIKFTGAHYFALGKQATIKAALNAGVFSSKSIFRNELFQIGGFKLLRGFSEESIYATQYSVATLEYRYLVGLRSYFFGFTDGAWVRNKYQNINASNNFFSAGAGMAFETKFGLLNISYALGKRDDVPFNFREASKIHFGYINYF